MFLKSKNQHEATNTHTLLCKHILIDCLVTIREVICFSGQTPTAQSIHHPSRHHKYLVYQYLGFHHESSVHHKTALPCENMLSHVSLSPFFYVKSKEGERRVILWLGKNAVSWIRGFLTRNVRNCQKRNEFYGKHSQPSRKKGF